MKWLSAFVLAAVLSGCTAYRPLPFRQSQAPPELPEDVRAYYDYPKLPLEAKLVLEKKGRGFTMYRYEMPLHLPPELEVPDLEAFRQSIEEMAKTDQKTARDEKLRYTNVIDFYVPNSLKPGQKRPLILVSPILGGNMVVDRFSNYYAGRGMTVALVHRKRIRWDDQKDIRQIEDYLRSSLMRVRQAIDWAQTRPEVDAERIGAFAISYGAIMHSMLAAIDGRVKFHVLSLPGGPLADVIADCPDGMITKLLNHVHDKYGWTRETVREDLRKTIRTDPMYLARYVDRDKVLFYVALFDRVVGAGRSFDLWREMGKPRLKVLPFGHYGGILVFPYLQTQSYAALKKALSQS